jgi:succinoglycan biosynthesis protein ExoM
MLPMPQAKSQTVARVCVAVPTYRRPEQLAVLLRHLALQIIDSRAYELRFVIIDNDILPTAESIVAATRAYFADPLGYIHLPEPGLAAVRNAALNFASAEDDYLVMIDDDEVPAPEWLAELLRVRALTGADAVIGSVPTYFPSGTPAWVKKGRFFELPRNKDCAEIDYGITGNCLLTIASIRAMGLHFDNAFGLSGGEDTMFFRQLRERGGKIVYAAKAVATEYIPLSRTRLRYLVARKFGNGNTHALCELQLDRTLRTECTVLLRGLLLVPWSLSMAPLRILFFGRAGAAKSIFDLSRAMGKLAAVIGFRFLGYSRANDAKWIGPRLW